MPHVPKTYTSLCADIRSRIDAIIAWKYLKVPFQMVALLVGIGTGGLLLWLALSVKPDKADIQTILGVGSTGFAVSMYLDAFGRRAAVVKSRANFLKNKLDRDGTGSIGRAMALENAAARAAQLKEIHYHYSVMIDKIVDFSKGVESKWEH